MEIPAWLFISFWAVISTTFLHLGFRALEKTELSNSVSPLLMFLFKHSLAISSCFSSSYALKFRSQPKHAVRSNAVLLVYVFFSVIFPRTIEGILIWHLLKSIFAWLLYFCKAIFSWLLYFCSKLKIFFVMIFRIPVLLFLSIWEILWKIMTVIGVINVALAAYHLPKSTLSSILNTVGAALFFSSVGILIQMIYTYLVVLFFSATEFLWIPIFSFLGVCIALAFLWFLCVGAYNLCLLCKDNFSELKTRSGLLLVLELSLFFASTTKKRNFSPILALSISHFICVTWAEASRFEDHAIVSEGLLHIGVKIVGVKLKRVMSKLKVHKAKKFIEFAVGTVGAILFQYFFKVTSMKEVAAFLSFAVMWVANMSLLGVSRDFGVFNFLLANGVMGCTVGEFGLHGATWLALGASLFLFALRLKLESLTIPYEQGQWMQLSFFGDEQGHDLDLDLDHDLDHDDHHQQPSAQLCRTRVPV